jgi:hypothetical protein
VGYRSHTSLYPASGKLPDKTECSIRKLYSIDETSECWRYFCRGEVEKFIAEYDKSHALSSAEPDQVPPLGGDAPERTRLVPLQWDASAEDKSTSKTYAFVALRIGQTSAHPVPGQIHLGFDLNCPWDKTDSLKMGLKRCLLIIDCAPGHADEFAKRTGHGAAGVEFDGAHFSTHDPNPQKPSWIITAIGPGVIGKVESVPSDFIRIDFLKPGSSIKARIQANVKEMLTTFEAAEKPSGDQSAAKRRIKARLKQLGIIGGDDGEADLAMNEISLMARPDVTEPEPKG